MSSQSKYKTMCLVKTNDPCERLGKKEQYFAVSENTADHMLCVDYSRMNDPMLRQINVEWIGDIQVEVSEE